MGMTLKGNEKLPYEIVKNIHVIKIASGADHIVFLTNHGEVYTCGCAEQGQLGRTTERGSSRNARSGIGKGQIGKGHIQWFCRLGKVDALGFKIYIFWVTIKKLKYQHRGKVLTL